MLSLIALALLGQLKLSEDGVYLGRIDSINCSGAGITCSVSARAGTVNVEAGGGGGVPSSIPAVTYSSTADLSAERVLSAGNYTVIDVGTADQAQVDWQHGLTCSAGQALTSSGTTAMACTSTIATATALAANPTDCGASQYATAIDASGNLTCAAVTVAGIPSFRRLDANYTNSTTGFTSTALSWTVLTGTTYIIDCALFYTTAVNTTALQVSLTGPTTSALRYHVNTETTATAAHAATQTAYDTVTNPATGAAAVPLAVYVSGSLVTTAGGTLAVRARSEINASLTTILAGSWCSLSAL